MFVAPYGLAAGFDAKYEVFTGDFDQDGDLDIYVRERAPLVMVALDDIVIPVSRAPKVQPFVLVQGPAGVFSLRTDLTNLSLGNRQPSAIEVVPIDVNLDGYLDAVIKGIGTVVAGAADQIVYANAAQGVRNIPVGIKAIDLGMKNFLAQAAGWVNDNNYLEIAALNNGWYTEEEGDTYVAWWNADYLYFWGFHVDGQYLVQNNEDPYRRSQAPASCSWGTVPCRFQNGVWQMWVNVTEYSITFDYSHFDSRAVSLVSSLRPAARADELVAGTADAQSASTILAQVLGRTVLNGVLVNGGRTDYETGPDVSLGKRRLAAIENMLVSLNAAVSQPTPQPSSFVKLEGVNVIESRVIQLERGAMTEVNGIVLHRTGGATLEGALRSAKTSRVGTHFYIDKNGDIHQTASLDQYAAHVGKLKSKCVAEPTTCTATERQDAEDALAGWRPKNLHNHEVKKPYPKRYPQNSDSVGIEVVAAYDSQAGTYEAATPEQIAAVATLVEALKSEYDLTNADVYHHDVISYKEGVGEGAGLGY
ncbi:peptidoglycan recognition protein family protein [Steroidobacter cummioxidans]|uniref:peptidoglycan recognition protein family protein n=1 Tax=Steroidobacter cummioxidans TaxID=1803913 RepID=UPI00137A2CE9|nr:peptidoglycan recognition family protein [Steroidobacter cummioxidans]